MQFYCVVFRFDSLVASAWQVWEDVGVQNVMGWRPQPLVKGWVRIVLAISPLLPIIFASVYFLRDLHRSPGYPVRIPWDQIRTIASVPSPGAASLSDEWALAVPIAQERDNDLPSGFDGDLGSAQIDDLEASIGESNRIHTRMPGVPDVLDGVLPLSFDLARRPATQGTIEVRKPVSFDQQALGTLSVRIDDSSRVYVSVLDMNRLFPEPLRPRRSWQDEYVLLSEVRTTGIDLRYDPTADQFILKDGSSD